MTNDWWLYLVLLAGMLILAYRRMNMRVPVKRRLPDRDFPYQWRSILEKRVPFYQKLPRTQRIAFEEQVHIFLLNVEIAGNETEVTDLDRILVASGAVIPTFKLKNWHYLHLNKVVIFPDKFIIPETDKKASGLVGWGEMEGQMWLSRKALYHGFHDTQDQKNVAIHEFIHLMDMQDGEVDGVMEKVMKETDIEPWLKIIQEKSEEMGTGASSIRDYATANRIEFLAVTGEFYFENPEKMRSEHPKLFTALDKIFNPDEHWV